MSRLPPAEKLPLAVRKNIRDNYEAKKDDLEKKLSDVLGVSWTVDIDPKQVFAYATDGYAMQSTGSMIAEYVSSATDQLGSFIKKTGEEGKAELNRVCSTHQLTMDLDVDQKFTYCGCDISPTGQLVILFRKGMLGTNIYDALSFDKLNKAVNEVPAKTESGGDSMTYFARTSISTQYEDKIGDTKNRLKSILNREIKLEPNFEKVYSTLKASGENPNNWETNIGMYLKGYFDGLADWLENKGFGKDDMLQEGFNEAVEYGQVSFRIVDQSKMKRSYNECVIEDGVLYLQTSLKHFGVNLHDVADNLMDLL